MLYRYLTSPSFGEYRHSDWPAFSASFLGLALLRPRSLNALAYERAMLHEVAMICASIPHADLAIQGDVCFEMLMWDGGFPVFPRFDGIETVFAEKFARLSRSIGKTKFLIRSPILFATSNTNERLNGVPSLPWRFFFRAAAPDGNTCGATLDRCGS